MKSSSTRLGRLGAVQGLAWLLFLAAGRADAAGISIVNVSSTGASTSTLAVGDVLTVDLVANNDTHLDIYGLELLAFGYDVDANGVADDGLRMAGLASTDAIFNTTVIDDVGSFGGLPHLRGTRGAEVNYPRAGLQTYLFRSISLTPASGDGSLDVGIAGGLIRDGDVHFRISFQATSLLDTRTIDLTFGLSNPAGSPIPGACRSLRGDAVVGTGGICHPFENETLRLSILADPDFVPGSGGGTGGTGGTGGGWNRRIGRHGRGNGRERRHGRDRGDRRRRCRRRGSRARRRAPLRRGAPDGAAGQPPLSGVSATSSRSTATSESASATGSAAAASPP
jgi:hypothetical protein